MKNRPPESRKIARPLRVGFVPLCDCAPIVMAQELGLFKKYGVKVTLSREVGWATVRDKLIYGDLDIVHALAPMALAVCLGLGSVQADCVTGLALSLNGNAITLAQSLWDAGARPDGSLQPLVRRQGTPLIFGVPFLYSSHYFVLRAWLTQRGLDPRRDARFVVVPPPQMAANLKAGHLHGYCVGEPWNSVAWHARVGWRAATAADIAPEHPEKILLARRAFAQSRAKEHECLIAALVDACRFCAFPENRERIVKTLGEPQYINAPFTALREGCELALRLPAAPDALDRALEPSDAKAAWVIEHLRESGLLADSVKLSPGAASEIFRMDIFDRALVRMNTAQACHAGVTDAEAATE